MLVLGALLLVLMVGPALWVRAVMATHGAPRPELPGTGGDLARHLLDQAGLGDIGVERTDRGDHYDPGARMVRLLPEHMDGRSVTALAVAAHEVSHALQHRDAMPAFRLRQDLAEWSLQAERIASLVLLATPLVALVVRSPGLMAGQVVLGMGIMALGVVVHAVTLPVELDASFRRALPLLGQGYLAGPDLRRARSVLRAAALTYLASALVAVVNVARWIRILR